MSTKHTVAFFAVCLCGLVAACGKRAPPASTTAGAAQGTSSAEPAPTEASAYSPDAATDEFPALEDPAARGVVGDAAADAGVRDAAPAEKPRSARFPKLILAPATQGFACNHYVNCFDDSGGRCGKQRDGGDYDADWTRRTRAAADGSPSACCYMTTMCKHPLPQPGF